MRSWELTLAGAAVAGMTGIIGVGLVLSERECSSHAEVMGMESSWGPMQGCMVKFNDRWLPMSAVRVFVQGAE